MHHHLLLNQHPLEDASRAAFGIVKKNNNHQVFPGTTGTMWDLSTVTWGEVEQISLMKPKALQKGVGTTWEWEDGMV